MAHIGPINVLITIITFTISIIFIIFAIPGLGTSMGYLPMKRTTASLVSDGRIGTVPVSHVPDRVPGLQRRFGAEHGQDHAISLDCICLHMNAAPQTPFLSALDTKKENSKSMEYCAGYIAISSH